MFLCEDGDGVNYVVGAAADGALWALRATRSMRAIARSASTHRAHRVRQRAECWDDLRDHEPVDQPEPASSVPDAAMQFGS